MRSIFILFVTTILFFSCYKEKDYDVDSNKSDNLFYVNTSKSSILADALSTTQIIVSFDKSVDSLKAATTFKTTAGVFQESGNSVFTITPTYNYDSSKLIATVKLNSSQNVDSAIVSVSVAGFTKSVIVQFTKSYPEVSKLTANTLSIKPKNNGDGEVQFTDKISKSIGLPSLNNNVDMKVYDTLYNPIGSFRVYSNKSDVSGITNYTYVLGDSVANGRYYTGKLFAISTTQRDQSTANLIRDTVILISSN